MRTRRPVLAIVLTAATGALLAIAAVLGLVALTTAAPVRPDVPLVSFTG
ncbi:hypothetical protein OG625_37990 [Streptomyces sp. NBC_01351]|nr:hypothetical protein [Streptomyces sp. NBC_01351]